MDRNAQFIEAFQALSAEVHLTAVSKGWWDERDQLIAVARAHSPELGKFAELLNASNLICLEHSELSEAVEGLRLNSMDDKIPEFTSEEAESADVIIRIMDRASARCLRIAEAIVAKMAMNKVRTHKHGGKGF